MVAQMILLFLRKGFRQGQMGGVNKRATSACAALLSLGAIRSELIRSKKVRGRDDGHDHIRRAFKQDDSFAAALLLHQHDGGSAVSSVLGCSGDIFHLALYSFKFPPIAWSDLAFFLGRKA